MSALPQIAEQARLRLFRLGDIPPPAGTAQEVVRVAGDEQVDLSKLVAIIEKSPEMTARILRCANSAYYGQRSHIHSVSEAVIRVLGLTVTRSLVLAMAVAGPFRLGACPPFRGERHWFVAAGTARLARNLARNLPPEEGLDPVAVHTAGLLHNLGMLAMVHAFPEAMTEVLAPCEAGATARRMREHLGIDYHLAGSWLARRWGLPGEIALVMVHHGNPNYRGKAWPLVNLIGLAARIADRVYAGEQTCLPPEGWPGRLPVEKGEVEAATRELCGQVESLRSLAHLLAGNGE